MRRDLAGLRVGVSNGVFHPAVLQHEDRRGNPVRSRKKRSPGLPRDRDCSRDPKRGNGFPKSSTSITTGQIKAYPALFPFTLEVQMQSLRSDPVSRCTDTVLMLISWVWLRIEPIDCRSEQGSQTHRTDPLRESKPLFDLRDHLVHLACIETVNFACPQQITSLDVALTCVPAPLTYPAIGVVAHV